MNIHFKETDQPECVDRKCQLIFCQRIILFSLILLFLCLNKTNKSSFNGDYFNLPRMRYMFVASAAPLLYGLRSQEKTFSLRIP